MAMTSQSVLNEHGARESAWPCCTSWDWPMHDAGVKPNGGAIALGHPLVQVAHGW